MHTTLQRCITYSILSGRVVLLSACMLKEYEEPRSLQRSVSSDEHQCRSHSSSKFAAQSMTLRRQTRVRRIISDALYALRTDSCNIICNRYDPPHYEREKNRERGELWALTMHAAGSCIAIVSKPSRSSNTAPRHAAFTTTGDSSLTLIKCTQYQLNVLT
jgi:hypothetical protein